MRYTIIYNTMGGKPLTREGSVGCNPMILKVTTSGDLIASESRVRNLS